MRSAHQRAYRAAQLFGAIEDPGSEILALVWFAYAASCLRHNEAALAAAMLATRLAESLQSAGRRVSALNCLGIALIANGDFERSDRAMSDAGGIAGAAGDPATEFLPRINRCYGEVVRLTVERHLYGRAPDPVRLAAFVGDCRRLRHVDSTPRRTPARLTTYDAMMAFAETFAACWQGDVVAARGHAERISPGPDAHGDWLDALAAWASCELACAQREWPRAESAERRMIDRALRVEHEQIARTGYMLLSQILDAQGRGGEALDALRLLAQRDIAIRRESLEHHQRVADWQVELRDSSMRVRKLETASRTLERLSLEDALTALPNRRHFERELARLLDAAPAHREPLSIALIDVDRFKAINDAHSHVVGDRVLKTLAGLIGGQVRDGDLPARLGGDEFVVLFRRAGAPVAAAVCERLRQVVAQHPWHGLAAGMTVSVSIGVAESVAGDTIESLLMRSDNEMYRAKANQR